MRLPMRCECCILKHAGYSVNAVELVDPEETPKNTLIRAVKVRGRNPEARRRFEQSCEYLGARPSKLTFDW